MSSPDSSPLNHHNSGPGILISCTILALISTVIFFLRIWARRLTRQPFALDDYFCLAALVVQHCLLGAAGVMVVKGGLGQDMRITSTKNPRSVVFLFQVRTLLGRCDYLDRYMAANGEGLGTLCRRDHLHMQLSADKTIRVGLLLAYIPYSTCQARVPDSWGAYYRLVHCGNYTEPCAMPSFEGFLVYGTPGAADHPLS